MGKFGFLTQNKFAWELRLPKRKLAQNETMCSVLSHTAGNVLALLWGLQPGLCTLLRAPLASARCSEGGERRSAPGGLTSRTPYHILTRRIRAWEKLKVSSRGTMPNAAHHDAARPHLPAGLWECPKWSMLALCTTCDPHSHTFQMSRRSSIWPW